MHSRYYSLVHLHLVTTCILGLIFSGTVVASRHKEKDCTRVHPRESIQKAIDDAQPGERIEIEGGTYYEQLTINKPGINLIGKDGATLLPPSHFNNNPCSGLSQTFDNKSTEAGICVHGNVVLQDYISEHRKLGSVSSYIENVSIQGLKIQGFTGENIAVLGGRNTHIKHNQLLDAGQYGFLSVGSKGTRATHNTVTTTILNFIGLSIDDTSDSILAHNDITGYFTALVSQTNGGIITQNKATNVCVGAAADPGVQRTLITSNSFSTRLPTCDPIYGAGVVVYGATQTLVQGNTIEKFVNAGFGVGIYLLPGPNGEPAQGNVVRGNVLSGNDVDVYDNSNRTNELGGNKCLSTGGGPSVPASACV